MFIHLSSVEPKLSRCVMSFFMNLSQPAVLLHISRVGRVGVFSYMICMVLCENLILWPSQTCAAQTPTPVNKWWSAVHKLQLPTCDDFLLSELTCWLDKINSFDGYIVLWEKCYGYFGVNQWILTVITCSCTFLSLWHSWMSTDCCEAAS